MTAATTPPLHVLRGILRLTKPAPYKPMPVSTAAATAATQQSGSSQPTNAELTIRQHILSQYRQSISLSPQKSKTQRQIAYEYFILKQDLKERGRLHDLDQGADEKLTPKELSQRAAARAGLQLPKVHSEGDA
mmetsp:Transcript_30344/g.54966  ORF Transcript_30344/g.54966 Transcript_30344/m.54966 type:complete len:133 (-) Transcript_30344:235-633(-)